MANIHILNEKELRTHIDLSIETIDLIGNAFEIYAKGGAVMPPILSMEIKEYNGEVDVKTAYVAGLDGFAIKVSPGFFNNPALGLPSLNGLMVYFDSKTGLVKALFLDNGFLTNIRTAAAGAVAARALTRPDSKTACILGTGAQAELQLKALMYVRDIKSATIWGRNPKQATLLANRLSNEFQIPIKSSHNLEKDVNESDVIITTTPAEQPVLDANWLRPGQHVTAMGSDADYKNEISAQSLNKSDLFICDSLAQCEKLGELHHMADMHKSENKEKIGELGDILIGRNAGRQTAEQITICDLTGMGIQDTAIANAVFDLIKKQNIGTEFAN